MSERDETADYQDRTLRELTELGLEFAREIRAQVRLVKSVEDSEKLTLAFHRATRTARLAIALQAKLARDRHEVARLDRNLAEQRTKERRAQIRRAIRNEIYVPEAEQEWADALAKRLDERLDQEALFDKFLTGPVETHIERVRKTLGLSLPREAAPDPYLPCRGSDGGGGPPAERSEERAVEGASQAHSASPQPSHDGDAVLSNHEPHEQALIPASRCNSS